MNRQDNNDSLTEADETFASNTKDEMELLAIHYAYHLHREEITSRKYAPMFHRSCRKLELFSLNPLCFFLHHIDNIGKEETELANTALESDNTHIIPLEEYTFPRFADVQVLDTAKSMKATLQEIMARNNLQPQDPIPGNFLQTYKKSVILVTGKYIQLVYYIKTSANNKWHKDDPRDRHQMLGGPYSINSFAQLIKILEVVIQGQENEIKAAETDSDVKQAQLAIQCRDKAHQSTSKIESQLTGCSMNYRVPIPEGSTGPELGCKKTSDAIHKVREAAKIMLNTTARTSKDIDKFFTNPSYYDVIATACHVSQRSQFPHNMGLGRDRTPLQKSYSYVVKTFNHLQILLERAEQVLLAEAAEMVIDEALNQVTKSAEAETAAADAAAAAAAADPTPKAAAPNKLSAHMAELSRIGGILQQSMAAEKLKVEVPNQQTLESFHRLKNEPLKTALARYQDLL